MIEMIFNYFRYISRTKANTPLNLDLPICRWVHWSENGPLSVSVTILPCWEEIYSIWKNTQQMTFVLHLKKISTIYRILNGLLFYFGPLNRGVGRAGSLVFCWTEPSPRAAWGLRGVYWGLAGGGPASPWNWMARSGINWLMRWVKSQPLIN